MDDPTGVTQKEGHIIGVFVLFFFLHSMINYSLYTPQGGYLAEFPSRKLAGV